MCLFVSFFGGLFFKVFFYLLSDILENLCLDCIDCMISVLGRLAEPQEVGLSVSPS